MRLFSTHFALLMPAESIVGTLLRPLFGQFRKVNSRKFTEDVSNFFLQEFLLVTLLVTFKRRSPATVLEMAVQADRGFHPRSTNRWWALRGRGEPVVQPA